MRVPTERAVPTTAVQVTFPSQVTVYAFAPPPAGWRMTTVQRGGRFVAVRYTGGAIPPDQYLDFHFLGTPTAYGTAVWKALQTYADGKVKPWTGPPEAPGATSKESGPTAPAPAPSVEISAPGAAPATASGRWLGRRFRRRGVARRDRHRRRGPRAGRRGAAVGEPADDPPLRRRRDDGAAVRHRLLAGVLVAVIAALVLPASALAHAVLVTASPAANARLAASPAEVTLTFNEEVQLLKPTDLSVVDATGAAGERGAGARRCPPTRAS